MINILLKIKQIPDEKKQKFLIIIFLFVLLITSILVRESFFRKKGVSITSPVNNVSGVISVYNEPKINFSILENPNLNEMKSFDKIPPLNPPYGRNNPFLPY